MAALVLCNLRGNSLYIVQAGPTHFSQPFSAFGFVQEDPRAVFADIVQDVDDGS